MDLWAEFRILDMGQRLGRFITKYRTDYFTPDKRNGQIIYSYKPLPYAEDAIYRQISDITISMKSADHLQMPELVSSEYTVQLSEDEREKYTDLKQELVLSLGAEKSLPPTPPPSPGNSPRWRTVRFMTTAAKPSASTTASWTL